MPLFRTKITAPEMAIVLFSIVEKYMVGNQGLEEFLKDLRKSDNPLNFQTLTLTESEEEKLAKEYFIAITFSIIHACQSQQFPDSLLQSILDPFFETVYSQTPKKYSKDSEIDELGTLLNMRFEEYNKALSSQDMFKLGTVITRNLFPGDHYKNVFLIGTCIARMAEVTKTTNKVMRNYRVSE